MIRTNRLVVLVLALVSLAAAGCEDPTTVADTCNGVLWYEADAPEDVTCIEYGPNR